MQARVDEMDRPEAICRKSVIASRLHLSPRELKELEMINDKLHPQPDKVKLTEAQKKEQFELAMEIIYGEQ